MQNVTQRVQFTHFLLHKVEELHFRLSELRDLCQVSRQRFGAGDPDASVGGRLVNFHFAAFSSLVQTIKDVLPVVSEKAVSWSGLSDIRHMQFMRAVRNAITHDGNPVVNMWVDGRFYIGCDFVRIDSKGKTINVKAPVEDIETLVVGFTSDLCSYLRDVLSPLRDNKALLGPLYGTVFFDNAINHPAVPSFAKNIYAATERSILEKNRVNPVEELLSVLSALVADCSPQEQAT